MPTGDMNAPMSAKLQSLIMRLLHEESLNTVACVTAQARHGVSSVDMPKGVFSLIMQGEKQVRHADQTQIFRPGDMLVVGGGTRLDLVHAPDAVSGRYLTMVVPFCEEVLAAARLVWGQPVLVPGKVQVGHFPVSRFEHDLVVWAEALLQGDYPAARVALVSMLVAWCRLGMSSLLILPPETLGRRIDAMVAAQPAHAWQSRDFEQHFNRSAATLRRHLAAEGSSLRALIADARLRVALDMLYTTRLPVKTVTARVGYQSAESFSRAFRARYGADPSAIGNG